MNLTIPAEDPTALLALETASGVVRNETDQQLDLVTDDQVRLMADGSGVLFLPQWPVVAVSAVSEGNTALVVADALVWTRIGMLTRTGRPWLAGPVTVTYSHGYAELPADVVGVVLAIAGRLYGDSRATLSAAGSSGLASEQLGSYAVSYQAPGSQNTAFWGAGAAWLLLPSEGRLLARYRLPGW